MKGIKKCIRRLEGFIKICVASNQSPDVIETAKACLEMLKEELDAERSRERCAECSDLTDTLEMYELNKGGYICKECAIEIEKSMIGCK